MSTSYLAFRVKGAFTSQPWVERLGVVEASNHSDAMLRARERFGGSYGGLAVVPRVEVPA